MKRDLRVLSRHKRQPQPPNADRASVVAVFYFWINQRGDHRVVTIRHAADVELQIVERITSVPHDGPQPIPLIRPIPDRWHRVVRVIEPLKRIELRPGRFLHSSGDSPCDAAIWVISVGPSFGHRLPFSKCLTMHFSRYLVISGALTEACSWSMGIQ